MLNKKYIVYVFSFIVLALAAGIYFVWSYYSKQSYNSGYAEEMYTKKPNIDFKSLSTKDE